MSRDFDPRSQDVERPDPSRSARLASDPRVPSAGDPRDVFTEGLDVPRGASRERVRAHEHTYSLRGSEARTLATIGAFRIVQLRDLTDHDGRPADIRTGDLRHLREVGLVRVVGVHGTHGARTTLVALTERGHELLEARRVTATEPRQAFHVGLAKRPELAHDMQVYRAYLRAAERLQSQGARIRRVVLDHELKREYHRVRQRLLRGTRRDTDGVESGPDDLEAWARSHHLPVDDGHVLFPDVRIEYDDRYGRPAVEDIEVMTAHYRGAHAAAKVRAGFTRYRGAGTAIGARIGGTRRGRPYDPRLAEEFLP